MISICLEKLTTGQSEDEEGNPTIEKGVSTTSDKSPQENYYLGLFFLTIATPLTRQFWLLRDTTQAKISD